MPLRPALLPLFALAILAAGGTPAPAQQDYLYGEKNFRNACPRPLKYAAGACVRRCPAGYRDLGGYYCRPPSGNGFAR